MGEERLPTINEVVEGIDALDEIGQRDDIHVIIKEEYGNHFIHCFVAGQVDTKELKGSFVKGTWSEWLFSKITLPDFAKNIEEVLDVTPVRYHRREPISVVNPIPEDQDLVTYELLRRQADEKGGTLYEFATQVLSFLSQ